jgi:hypothetical protein
LGASNVTESELLPLLRGGSLMLEQNIKKEAGYFPVRR